MANSSIEIVWSLRPAIDRRDRTPLLFHFWHPPTATACCEKSTGEVVVIPARDLVFLDSADAFKDMDMFVPTDL